MTDGRFAICVHILTLLAKAGKEWLEGEAWLSSEFIASSININPVLVRKEISNLRHAGLVQSKEGKNGGSALAKPADQILLSEVYKVVYDRPVLGLAKNDPNPKCPVGREINAHLTALYQEAERGLLEKLGHTTLQQFEAQFT